MTCHIHCHQISANGAAGGISESGHLTTVTTASNEDAATSFSSRQ